MSAARSLHMAVVGGRGWLGRAVVRVARLQGLAVTVVSCTPASGVVAVDPGDTGSLARVLARADVVVNTAGYRGPDARRAVGTNFKLAEDLARLAAAGGWRLVHVGSAAEYGPQGPGLGTPDLVTEDAPCTPTTLYGVTKLAGSQAVERGRDEGADTVVARVFNLVAGDLPDDSPLRDLVGQLRAVAATGGVGDVVVGDPTTVRDMSRRSWAAAMLVALGRSPVPFEHGVVNVCSGRPTGFGELVEAMARHLGVRATVRDLGWPRGGHIVGDPTRLRALAAEPWLDRLDDLVRSILGPAPSVRVLAGDPR